MTKKDMKYFEELLKGRLEELLQQADSTVSGMTDPKENFPDPTDRASLEAERNFMLRIRDRESKLIKKVKKALERIVKMEDQPFNGHRYRFDSLYREIIHTRLTQGYKLYHIKVPGNEIVQKFFNIYPNEEENNFDDIFIF